MMMDAGSAIINCQASWDMDPGKGISGRSLSSASYERVWTDTPKLFPIIHLGCVTGTAFCFFHWKVVCGMPWNSFWSQGEAQRVYLASQLFKIVFVYLKLFHNLTFWVVLPFLIHFDLFRCLGFMSLLWSLAKSCPFCTQRAYARW